VAQSRTVFNRVAFVVRKFDIPLFLLHLKLAHAIVLHLLEQALPLRLQHEQLRLALFVRHHQFLRDGPSRRQGCAWDLLEKGSLTNEDVLAIYVHVVESAQRNFIVFRKSRGQLVDPELLGHVEDEGEAGVEGISV